ncbi:LysR family transcriptional regulator [Enterobacter sp. RHBSTW-00994]|uniref:DNA-binding transcriptional repressor CitR n=1 Tax=Enterobacteriaceae TaxID=543 RepID=UPI0015EA200D|nr:MULTISPECIES: LysR family transcriptional regulator [Enterobacteriaceae]MBM3069881.1 LysR family transcriptional regulator [Lelliottia sp. RWM.1]QLR42244.1 LysR family transcriptional regulator [Enterobacter sp. RHBSTW-00994]
MANLYDLKKFDLNLLVIFECIYQHLSISKAAETLYITPSAVSQSLQRLRNQLNDPLFIRSGKGITPTTVGVNLHHHLEQNLNQIEQTINIMHSSELKKNFVIFCPQVIAPGALLSLVNFLISEHHYKIELRDMLLSPESAEDLLAYRKADLVFTFSPVNNRSVICSRFRVIPMILICNKDHPRLGDKATREELMNENFTLFHSNEHGVKEFQAQAESIFPDRNIVFSSDSFISIINIISTSDLIGYIPEIAYESYKTSMNVKRVEIPFELPVAEVYMLYNRASLNSAVFSQIIEQIPLE